MLFFIFSHSFYLYPVKTLYALFKCAANFGNFDSPTPNVWSKIIYSRLDLLSLKKVSCSYIEPYIFNNLKDLGILRLRRSRAGKRVFKANSWYIAVIIRQDRSYTFNHRHVNFANLREICISTVATSTITDQTKLCLWNAQSLRNKSACLVDYIYERNVDLFAVTESWLMETDAAVKSECTPDGYKMFSTSRPDRKGGGIALICRSNMTVREVDVPQRSSFEMCEWSLSSGHCKMRLSILYRPPWSSNNPISISTFYD